MKVGGLREARNGNGGELGAAARELRRNSRFEETKKNNRLIPQRAACREAVCLKCGAG